MDVHRQRCQNCDSINLRNIIAREANHPTVVYVRCQQCKELVARYELSNYYHHGKGMESYLRSHGVASNDSAREWLKEFQHVQQDALTGYEAALMQLNEQQKEV